MSIKDKIVLIIEDVPDQALLARKILENIGLVTFGANSVDSAIESLKDKSPHLILLDLEMPNRSGFEFLTYRSTNPALKDVPVVVTSGLQNPDAVYKSIAMGAADYLIKPYPPAKLLQKVRKLLKDTVFKSHDFNKEDAPSVKLLVGSEITKVGSTGFSFESQIKIGPREQVYLRGENLDFLHGHGGLYISEDKPSERISSGAYTTNITIVGLTKPLKKMAGKK